MFKKEKKAKSNYYFDSFPVLMSYAVKCGEEILSFFKSFDASKAELVKNKVHEYEHQADDLKHEVTAKLLTEFMTPIDREDIFELLKLIDDVTDAIEEISLKIYLYNYVSLPPDTIPFLELSIECMKKTVECLEQFPSYLDKDVFEPYVQEVVRLEEEGDERYIKDMRELYLKKYEPLLTHQSEAIYSMLEEVSDRCREVCRFVKNIALKNI